MMRSAWGVDAGGGSGHSERCAGGRNYAGDPDFNKGK